MQQFVDLDQVLVRIGQVAFGERSLGPFQHAGQGLGALAAGGMLLGLDLLAPLRASVLARVFLGPLPLLEALTQRVGEAGIGQRRELPPAPRSVVRRRGTPVASPTGTGFAAASVGSPT